MKRIKTSNRTIKFANDLIRPSPFAIVQKKETKIKEDEKQIYNYKDCKVVVYGRLYEEDRATLFCLMKMAKKHDNHQPFDFKLSDIAKAKNLENPYQETSLRPFRESIDRLLDASIRIRPTNGKGLSARFNFVEGWLNSDDTGNLTISPYLSIVQDLALVTTYIHLDTYFKIKSQIGRSIYTFLSSQQPFYQGGKYEIRLASLSNYINYDTQGKPWFQIRPYFKKAAEELKQVGFLDRYKYDSSRCKSDGGVMEFWPAETKPKELSTGKRNQEILQLIKDEFPEIEWTEAAENKLRTVLNKTAKFLEQYRDKPLKDVISGYCGWLKNKNRLKFLSHKLFDSDNMFFQEFIKQERNSQAYGNEWLTHEEYEEKYSKSKPISEEEREAREKEWEEKKRRLKSMKLKCPHGYQIGKDCGKAGVDDKFEVSMICDKCELYDDCFLLSRIGRMEGKF